MEGQFGPDVVVREGMTILRLLAGKYKMLLVGQDTLLVLDLCLDVVDVVGRPHLEGDRLVGQTKHQGDCGPLNVLVRQSTSILQLLASKGQEWC